MGKAWLSEESVALLKRAKALTPAGVHSNVRSAAPPHPLFFERGQGSRLWDVDGNSYIDMALGQGPLLLGHAHPAVTDAVAAALTRGQLFGGQHDAEVELAELIKETVPCAERIRFSSTGSEATHAALRFARAATGRSRVVKFEGHYHGWFDGLNVSVTPGRLPSRGTRHAVPEGEGQIVPGPEEVTVLEWNDLKALRDTLDSGDVAAVIMEPVAANNAVIAPRPGYLEGVREVCTRHGTVLIFDEVITGFRLGLAGAQGRFGVTPDLATFGKALASGFPLSCVAGRADLFDGLDDSRVTHAGTFNANVSAVAAALATLKFLRDFPQSFDDLRSVGARLNSGLGQYASRGLVVQGFPEACWVGFGPGPVHSAREIMAFDLDRGRRLIGELVRRGVYATARGTFFTSIAHTPADMDDILDAFDRAFDAIDR